MNRQTLETIAPMLRTRHIHRQAEEAARLKLSASNVPLSASILDDLPIELLAEILTRLPYWDLLRAASVSKRWRTLVEAEPELRVRMFKQASDVYVDPGIETPQPAKGSDLLVLHPLLKIAEYSIGDPLANLYIYNKGGWRQTSGPSTDLACIPSVSTLSMRLESYDRINHFEVDATNETGVTLLDVFTALRDAAKKEVETVDGRMILLDAIEPHVFYEGVCLPRRIGSRLNVQLTLGS